jgi:riboflavin kinase/FMN adenylyltransferase
MLSGSTTSKNSITSLALGGFDGLHVAHQCLIESLDDNGALLVINKGYATLTPRREAFTDLPVFYYDLMTIKELSPEAFIDKVCREFSALERIVVGYDFRFGKGRSGSIEFLQIYFKGEVRVIDEVLIDGISIHSQTIREYVSEGKIEQANSFLGRDYLIQGRQIRGQGLGSKELVPTINIDSRGYTLPKEGVYVTITNGHKSITFIGKRASSDGEFAIETHLLESFDEVESHTIEFLEFVRENRKFDSFEALKKQIEEDIRYARERHGI